MQLEGATVDTSSENVPGLGDKEGEEPDTPQRTYKWFPSMFLLVAPRKLISVGSECSSPTMVGPASCGGGRAGERPARPPPHTAPVTALLGWA